MYYICAVLQLQTSLETLNTLQLKQAIKTAESFEEQLGEFWSTAQSGVSNPAQQRAQFRNCEFACAVLAARQQLEACLENPDTQQLKEAIDAAEPFKEQLGELWSTAQSGMLLEAFASVLSCVCVFCQQCSRQRQKCGRAAHSQNCPYSDGA